MLKAMGSYNNRDPHGIEVELLNAVIATNANALLNQGHVEDAIALFKSAFEIQQSAYKTTTHANIVYTLRCLADAYAMQGKTEKAHVMYEKALVICTLVYNNDTHAEVIAIHQALQTNR